MPSLLKRFGYETSIVSMSEECSSGYRRNEKTHVKEQFTTGPVQVHLSLFALLYPVDRTLGLETRVVIEVVVVVLFERWARDCHGRGWDIVQEQNAIRRM